VVASRACGTVASALVVCKNASAKVLGSVPRRRYLPGTMGDRTVASRVVGVCVLTGLVACAEKTPPPHSPQAATAPLTTPVPGGVPAGPPIEFMAAAAARPLLLATVSISSVDRLLANGTKLVGQAMPLPMDAAGLRDMMLSQAGLPPEVAANMDFASPSAAAFVALDGKGKSGAVMAVPRAGRPRRRRSSTPWERRSPRAGRRRWSRETRGGAGGCIARATSSS
jgi:hypothetical protein